MSTEHVVVAAGGMAYTGWKAVSIKAAVNEAARSFNLETTERLGEWSFPPGTPVQIMAGGELMVDGYVNKYHSSGAAQAHSVSISGRGKGQDFIDSSAVHPTGYAKNKTPAQFGQELDKFGVGITDKVGLKPVPMQQIYQGETCFRCLERHLRPHGASMMGEADGSISITNAKSATRVGAALVEGVNIMEWSVDLSDENRHSDYTVKGQNRHGSGEENLRIKEEAKDGAVKRYRPRVIVHETDTDKGRARERANHEKERCAGNGTKASVTIQGWRLGGALVVPNAIVFVSSPILMHLVQDMLIESVDYLQSDKGTTAKLCLVDPRAYRGKGGSGAGGGSDAAWDQGG